MKYQKTKTILCKPNDRSADFTSANFILGCKGKRKQYKQFIWKYGEE